MPKIEREIVVLGEQQPDIDVVSLARVIVRYVRDRVRQAEAEPAKPPDHTAGQS